MPVQLAALSEHHAQVFHHPLAVPLRRYSMDKDLAAGGLHDTGQHLHRSTFSGSVGADVADNVPFRDVKGDVVHRPDIFRPLHKEVFHGSPQNRFPF